MATIVGYLWLLPLKTRPDAATFALLALGLLAVLSSQGLRPRLGRIDYIVISLVVAAAGISTLQSVDPTRSARYFAYLCLNVFLLALATTMVSRRSVRVIAAGIGVFGILHLFALLVAHLFAGPASPDVLAWQPRMGTLIVPNDAMILGLCLPSLAVAAFVFSGGRRLVYGIALALYVILAAYVSYLLQSKMTLLGLVAPLLVMAAVCTSGDRVENAQRNRVVVAVSVFAALLLLSASAWYFGNQSTTRLSLWSTALSGHQTTAEVLFGAGPNTFNYEPGQAVSEFDQEERVVPWVHNTYLEAYYDQGLVGLVGILALTIIPVKRAAKIEDRPVRTLLLASMITFCLLALFEITLTRRFYLAYVVVMYGLARAQSGGKA